MQESSHIELNDFLLESTIFFNIKRHCDLRDYRIDLTLGLQVDIDPRNHPAEEYYLLHLSLQTTDKDDRH